MPAATADRTGGKIGSCYSGPFEVRTGLEVPWTCDVGRWIQGSYMVVDSSGID